MHELDIKQESYFPQNFKFFGGLLIFGAFLTLGTAEVFSLVRVIAFFALLGFGIVIISMRYGLKINVTDKTYTVYTLLLGFKIGKPESFNYIEKFYINQVTEKALATTRTGAKFDVRNKVYKAFIRLDNGEKIHLDTDNSEPVLMQRVDGYKKIVEPIYRPAD